MRIVSVGECTVDHYLDLHQQFPGGIALNFAVHCRRSGAEQVALVSRAGRDFAPRILRTLASEGVDATHVQTREGPTARQNIRLTPGGERIFPLGGYTAGVLEGFQLDRAEQEFIRQHAVVACALFAQVEPLFNQVLALPFTGIRVADFLDLSDNGGDPAVLERYADRLAIAFISGDRALAERLRPLARDSRCIIVITLGAQGSLALVGDALLYQPALPVPRVIDTTGCGDAFQAAFTVARVRGATVQDALRAGAERAALVAQHLGAVS